MLSVHQNTAELGSLMSPQMIRGKCYDDDEMIKAGIGNASGLSLVRLAKIVGFIESGLKATVSVLTLVAGIFTYSVIADAVPVAALTWIVTPLLAGALIALLALGKWQYWQVTELLEHSAGADDALGREAARLRVDRPMIIVGQRQLPSSIFDNVLLSMLLAQDPLERRLLRDRFGRSIGEGLVTFISPALNLDPANEPRGTESIVEVPEVSEEVVNGNLTLADCPWRWIADLGLAVDELLRRIQLLEFPRLTPWRAAQIRRGLEVTLPYLLTHHEKGHRARVVSEAAALLKKEFGQAGARPKSESIDWLEEIIANPDRMHIKLQLQTPPEQRSFLTW